MVNGSISAPRSIKSLVSAKWPPSAAWCRQVPLYLLRSSTLAPLSSIKRANSVRPHLAAHSSGVRMRESMAETLAPRSINKATRDDKSCVVVVVVVMMMVVTMAYEYLK